MGREGEEVGRALSCMGRWVGWVERRGVLRWEPRKGQESR